MNPFVCIMLIFAIIGSLIRSWIINSAWHLPLIKELSPWVILCYQSVVFTVFQLPFYETITEILNRLGDFLFFDPSILIGSLLAPDLGGYSIVEMISKDPNMIVFAGVLLTSTIGATISFQLPIFFK